MMASWESTTLSAAADATTRMSPITVGGDFIPLRTFTSP
jgi:hypothetical protein